MREHRDWSDSDSQVRPISLHTFLLHCSVCANFIPSHSRWKEPGKRIPKFLSVDTSLMIHSRSKKRAISYMRTEPIKCLSSVSKANMGGIKNFPSAVITPITLPVADSTVICLVQLCFGLLPGLIGFVYADCSFAELLSWVFFFMFSLFPGPSSEPRIALFPLCLLPAWAGYCQRAMSFFGARDAAGVPN